MLQQRRLRQVILGFGLLALSVQPAEAGGLFRKHSRTVVPTTAQAPAPLPATLGTFYATPTMTVKANWPTGTGYAPMGTYGSTAMSIYGPMSALRSTAAPLLMY